VRGVTAKSKVHENNKKNKAHSKLGVISQISNIIKHSEEKEGRKIARRYRQHKELQ